MADERVIANKSLKELENLTSDILMEIFSYCSRNDLYNNLSLVNHAFHKAAMLFELGFYKYFFKRSKLEEYLSDIRNLHFKTYFASLLPDWSHHILDEDLKKMASLLVETKAHRIATHALWDKSDKLSWYRYSWYIGDNEVLKYFNGIFSEIEFHIFHALSNYSEKLSTKADSSEKQGILGFQLLIDSLKNQLVEQSLEAFLTPRHKVSWEEIFEKLMAARKFYCMERTLALLLLFVLLKNSSHKKDRTSLLADARFAQWLKGPHLVRLLNALHSDFFKELVVEAASWPNSTWAQNLRDLLSHLTDNDLLQYLSISQEPGLLLPSRWEVVSKALSLDFTPILKNIGISTLTFLFQKLYQKDNEDLLMLAKHLNPLLLAFVLVKSKNFKYLLLNQKRFVKALFNALDTQRILDILRICPAIRFGLLLRHSALSEFSKTHKSSLALKEIQRDQFIILEDSLNLSTRFRSRSGTPYRVHRMIQNKLTLCLNSRESTLHSPKITTLSERVSNEQPITLQTIISEYSLLGFLILIGAAIYVVALNFGVEIPFGNTIAVSLFAAATIWGALSSLITLMLSPDRVANSSEEDTAPVDCRSHKKSPRSAFMPVLHTRPDMFFSALKAGVSQKHSNKDVSTSTCQAK